MWCHVAWYKGTNISQMPAACLHPATLRWKQQALQNTDALLTDYTTSHPTRQHSHCPNLKPHITLLDLELYSLFCSCFFIQGRAVELFNYLCLSEWFQTRQQLDPGPHHNTWVSGKHKHYCNIIQRLKSPSGYYFTWSFLNKLQHVIKMDI